MFRSFQLLPTPLAAASTSKDVYRSVKKQKYLKEHGVKRKAEGFVPPVSSRRAMLYNTRSLQDVLPFLQIGKDLTTRDEDRGTTDQSDEASSSDSHVIELNNCDLVECPIASDNNRFHKQQGDENLDAIVDARCEEGERKANAIKANVKKQQEIAWAAEADGKKNEDKRDFITRLKNLPDIAGQTVRKLKDEISNGWEKLFKPTEEEEKDESGTIIEQKVEDGKIDGSASGAVTYTTNLTITAGTIGSNLKGDKGNDDEPCCSGINQNQPKNCGKVDYTKTANITAGVIDGLFNSGSNSAHSTGGAAEGSGNKINSPEGCEYVSYNNAMTVVADKIGSGASVDTAGAKPVDNPGSNLVYQSPLMSGSTTYNNKTNTVIGNPSMSPAPPLYYHNGLPTNTLSTEEQPHQALRVQQVDPVTFGSTKTKQVPVYMWSQQMESYLRSQNGKYKIIPVQVENTAQNFALVHGQMFQAVGG
uniref:Uncharacterized protein LOC100183107 n=1 Tax=Phallusia mammillata TaxID=59560 RepID=A0A6F9DH80_9ASCI|nr:uncharacterized protein LOC100183107 [Phallusia mammillata]